MAGRASGPPAPRFDNDDTFYLLTLWTSDAQPPTHHVAAWHATTAHARLQASDGVNEVSARARTRTRIRSRAHDVDHERRALLAVALYFDTCADHTHPPRDHVDCRAERLGSCLSGSYSQAFFMRRYSNQFFTDGYLVP